ncbi:MAG: exosortase/archaeosortase family protein [Planctomycetota bacterium]|jgi:exosortase
MRKRDSRRSEDARSALLRARGIEDAEGAGRRERCSGETRELNSSISQPHFVFTIVVIFCFFLASYWKTLVAMERQWRTEPDYSHGYLILPLSAILLYSRRASFPGFSPRIHWMGLSLLCIAAALRIASSLAFMEFLDGWSIVPWVAGIVWMLAGPRALIWAIPAILFLILLVPLPYRVETLLSLKLQSVVTTLSASTLRALGLPAVADGNTIWMGELQMLVEEACSGLRIFVGMAAFAFFWATLIQRAWIDRVIVLVAALPMAVLANIIRVVATCCSYYFFDESTAGVLHDWEGVFMVFLAAGLLWSVMFYWQKLYYPDVSLTPRSQLRPG